MPVHELDIGAHLEGAGQQRPAVLTGVVRRRDLALAVARGQAAEVLGSARRRRARWVGGGENPSPEPEPPGRRGRVVLALDLHSQPPAFHLDLGRDAYDGPVAELHRDQVPVSPGVGDDREPWAQRRPLRHHYEVGGGGSR